MLPLPSMHGARITNTVHVASCTVRDVSFERCYAIPLSRLLSIEKHRGFENDSLRRNIHQPAASFHHQSSSRPFSSQACKARPVAIPRPPPRRAPPSGSPRPARPPSATPIEPELVIGTSEEALEEQRLEEELAAVRQRHFKKWRDEVSLVVQRATRSGVNCLPQETSGQVISKLLASARTQGLHKWHEYLRTYWETKQNIQRGLQAFPLWSKQFQASLRADIGRARAEGKCQASLWNAWRRYHKKHLANFEDRVHILERNLADLGQEVSQCRYAVAWWHWRSEELAFRADATAEYVRGLKADDSDSRLLSDRIEEITNSDREISDLIFNSKLDSLVREDLSAQTQGSALSIWDKRPYMKISSKNLGSSGHVYRAELRLHEIYRRFPEAGAFQLSTYYANASLIASITLAQDSEEIAYWMTTTRKLSSELGSGRTKKEAKKHAYRAKKWAHLTARLDAHTSQLYNLLKIWEAVAVEGMILSNPSLQSEAGQRIFTRLRPLWDYASVLREVTNTFRSLRTLDFELTGMHRKGIEGHQVFEFLIKDAKRARRDYFHSLNELIPYTIARSLLSEGSSQPLSWVIGYEQSQKASQVSAALSYSKFYKNSHASVDAIADPIKMKGDGLLYPIGASLPVRYILTATEAEQVLVKLRTEHVLGFDVIPRRSGSNSYLTENYLFCTTTTMFIFDSAIQNDPHAPPPSLTKLLEDPKIVKVICGRPAVHEYLSHTGIQLQTDVDISPRRGMQEKTGIILKRAIAEHFAGRFERGNWEAQNFRGLIHLMENHGVTAAITDMALRPVYNLVTLLNAVAVSPTMLDTLPADYSIHLRVASEQMRQKLATGQGIPGLGPVQWGESPSQTATGFVARMSSVVNAPTISSDKEKVSLPQLVQLMAVHQLKTLSLTATDLMSATEFKAQDTQKSLASYYLFTTFGQRLDTISEILEFDSPSEKISWISDKLGLRLKTRHRNILSLAASSPESKSTKVLQGTPMPSPESGNTSITKKKSSTRRERARKEQILNKVTPHLQATEYLASSRHAGPVEQVSNIILTNPAISQVPVIRRTIGRWEEVSKFFKGK